MIAALDAEALRRLIPAWVGERVRVPPPHLAEIEASIAAELRKGRDAEVRETLLHYAQLGSEYRLYRADALARRAGRAFVDSLTTDREVSGVEHLREAMKRGPCFILSSHLSYADSQFTDAALAAMAGSELADRLVFVAGPKVYTDPFRRMAAAGLNTLQTAQSTRLSYNEAELSPREVARVAIRTVRTARELAEQGDLILLYGQGSRSRDGRLGSFLKAISRYPGKRAQIVPFALSGTEAAFPVHQIYLFDAPIRLCIGPAVELEGGDPVAAVQETWRRIAELLPEAYRPAPGTPALR